MYIFVRNRQKVRETGTKELLYHMIFYHHLIKEELINVSFI